MDVVVADLPHLLMVFGMVEGENFPSPFDDPFADLFVVQWPDKAVAFPRAVVASGPLL